MLNIFKSKNKPMTTVKQIHNEFYSSEERLLQEAKAIINAPIEKAVVASRLVMLGFTSTKVVSEHYDEAIKRLGAKKLAASIEYFRVYYPNYKFITEAEVEKICKKYGLVLGNCQQYTGDIPEKNLVAIENFKLREEDFQVEHTWEMTLNSPFSGGTVRGLPGGGWYTVDSSLPSPVEKTIILDRNGHPLPALVAPTHTTTPTATKPDFKICAPPTDMNVQGYELKDGYRLVYDPVVLQPVKGGYLIISAWGNEASDEIVVNEGAN